MYQVPFLCSLSVSIAIDLDDDYEALELLLETLGAPCNTTTDCAEAYYINETKFGYFWDCTNNDSSTINNICVLDSCNTSTECPGFNDICQEIEHYCDENKTNTTNNDDEYQLFSTICFPNNTCSSISNIKQDNNDMVCKSVYFHHSF